MSTAAPRDPFRQQFEQRMRLRRASTCVAAARAALADGRLVDAQSRLEEATALDPDNAEARLLIEEMASLEALTSSEGVPPRTESDPGWAHWVAVVVAIVALAALAVLWPRSPAPGGEPARRVPRETTPSRPAFAEAPRQSVEVPSATEALAPPEAGAAPLIGTSGTSAEPEQRLGPQPAPGVKEGTRPSNTDDARRASPQGVPSETVLPAAAPASLPTANGGIQANESSPATVPASSDAPLPVVVVPRETPATETVADRLPATNAMPARTVEPPALAAATRPDPAAAVAADTESIEATLRRYADAYSALDARAARAIWPSVDEGALARAFEGLSSQGIEFDRCDVDLRGDEAMAQCNGRARYVRKVGTREPLTERRQWTFRLRRASENRWEILRAEAR